MTFEEARSLFPVLESVAYLNAGTFGPLARPVAQALEAGVERDLERGRTGKASFEETLALLTNREVLAVNQHSSENHQLFSRDGQIAWLARVPDSQDRYLALFNARSPLELTPERAAFRAELVSETRSSSAPPLSVDVDVRGATRIVLVTDDGEANSTHWVGVWGEPRCVLDDGSERPLVLNGWKSASAWWGDQPRDHGAQNKALSSGGVVLRDGFAAPTKSVIEFDLPDPVRSGRNHRTSRRPTNPSAPCPDQAQFLAPALPPCCGWWGVRTNCQIAFDPGSHFLPGWD